MEKPVADKNRALDDEVCFSIIVSVRIAPVTSYLSSVERVQVIMWANIVALSWVNHQIGILGQTEKQIPQIFGG